MKFHTPAASAATWKLNKMEWKNNAQSWKFDWRNSERKIAAQQIQRCCNSSLSISFFFFSFFFSINFIHMCIENAIIFLFSVLLKSIELIKTKRSYRNKLDWRHFKYGTSEMNERMNDSFIGICNSIPRALSQVFGTSFVYDHFLHCTAFQHALQLWKVKCAYTTLSFHRQFGFQTSKRINQ